MKVVSFVRMRGCAYERLGVLSTAATGTLPNGKGFDPKTLSDGESERAVSNSRLHPERRERRTELKERLRGGAVLPRVRGDVLSLRHNKFDWEAGFDVWAIIAVAAGENPSPMLG